MSTHFAVIISGNAQLLRSPGGEKVPNVIDTKIYQYCREAGQCEFRLYINDAEKCTYNPITKELKMPSGEVLPVEILEYKPEERGSEGLKNLEMLKACCTVIFPYETKHETRMPASEPLTSNQ